MTLMMELDAVYHSEEQERICFCRHDASRKQSLLSNFDIKFSNGITHSLLVCYGDIVVMVARSVFIFRNLVKKYRRKSVEIFGGVRSFL